jgi:tetratricopeptide (TPR) repeat protein
MTGKLLDTDPELAYKHAQEALRRGGRVDIVREAAGLAAYYTERYAEALREFRTVRRLNGSSEHLPLMADCERGLERPEKAIALAQSEEAATLSIDGQLELAIVVAGARVDLGENDAALAHLESIEVPAKRRDLAVRLIGARVAILELLGRSEEAEELLSHLSPAEIESIEEPLGEVDEDVLVYDLVDDFVDADPEDIDDTEEDAEAAEADDAEDDEPEADQDGADSADEGPEASAEESVHEAVEDVEDSEPENSQED